MARYIDAADKARWKFEWNGEWKYEVPTCSNCGYTPDNWFKYDYCPRCGTRMTNGVYGEENE